MDNIIHYLQQNYNFHLEELKEFIRYESISNQSEHYNDIVGCAHYVYTLLEKAGLKAEKIETDGNPIIYGEWKSDYNSQTILIYGHYDVQPIESEDLWDSPPFNPTIRQGYLFGRGASDNKSQIFLHIKVIEAYLETYGSLPFNVKFCIEGEEEVGSASMFQLLKDYPSKLNCNQVMISDTAMIGENIPSICIGLRGIVGFEIHVEGPKSDLPSGSFYGGAIQNPIHALSEIITRLRGTNGKIQVPGFYDHVKENSHKEKQSFNILPFTDNWLLQQTQVPALFGENDYTSLERAWVRPTLEVNGIHGGYTAEGSKTIIPHKAVAKVTCRLVPNQQPQKILNDIKDFIKANTPTGVSVIVEETGEFALPYSLDYSEPTLKHALTSLEYGFNKGCHIIKAGGSIPIVAEIYKQYNCPIILMGFGLPNGNVHGPNEHFSLEHYQQGMSALTYFYRNYQESY